MTISFAVMPGDVRESGVLDSWHESEESRTVAQATRSRVIGWRQAVRLLTWWSTPTTTRPPLLASPGLRGKGERCWDRISRLRSMPTTQDLTVVMSRFCAGALVGGRRLKCCLRSARALRVLCAGADEDAAEVNHVLAVTKSAARPVIRITGETSPYPSIVGLHGRSLPYWT